MSTSPSNIGVIFGGPSPEHDVSILTGLQAVRTLHDGGNFLKVHALYWSKSGDFYLVERTTEAIDFADGPPRTAQPISLLAGGEGGFVSRRGKMRGGLEQINIDVAVICTHGGPGEDGSLQGALDLAGISYTGPSAASAGLGMDKFAAGEVVRAAGLPTLPRAVLDDQISDLPFDCPYIVKPRFGGSSIGIDVVADLATAQARLRSNVHLRRGAVIEPYRAELYDLQIALLSYPELQLSAIERPIRKQASGEILDYRDKYVGTAGMDGAARELPALISPELQGQIEEIAKKAATALGVRGVARIDFLSDGTSVYLNEINTIPGSLSRYLFIDPPLAFGDLLSGLVREAMDRPAAQFSSAGADSALLRDAQSISTKLG